MFAAPVLNHETLCQNLREPGKHVEQKVLFNMIVYYAPQMLLANEELLCRYYDAARASLQANTRANLKAEADLVCNGAVAGGPPSRCVNTWLSRMCVPSVQTAKIWFTYILLSPSLSMTILVLQLHVAACRGVLLIGVCPSQ